MRNAKQTRAQTQEEIDEAKRKRMGMEAASLKAKLALEESKTFEQILKKNEDRLGTIRQEIKSLEARIEKVGQSTRKSCEPTHRDDPKEIWMLMEVLPGESLEYHWRKLRPEAKLALAQQLAKYVQQLRTLPQPQELFGAACSMTGGPFIDGLLQSFCPPGLFATWPDLLELMISPVVREYDEVEKARVEEVLSRGAEPFVFTHNDLNLSNIMITKPKFSLHWRWVMAKSPRPCASPTRFFGRYSDRGASPIALVIESIPARPGLEAPIVALIACL